jgi:hypothetical protein
MSITANPLSTAHCKYCFTESVFAHGQCLSSRNKKRKGTHQECIVEFIFSSSRVWISTELWRVVEDYEERPSFGVVGPGINC